MKRQDFINQAIASGKAKEEIRPVFERLDAAGEFEDSPNNASLKLPSVTADTVSAEPEITYGENYSPSEPVNWGNVGTGILKQAGQAALVYPKAAVQLGASSAISGPDQQFVRQFAASNLPGSQAAAEAMANRDKMMLSGRDELLRSIDEKTDFLKLTPEEQSDIERSGIVGALASGAATMAVQAPLFMGGGAVGKAAWTALESKYGIEGLKRISIGAIKLLRNRNQAKMAEDMLTNASAFMGSEFANEVASGIENPAEAAKRMFGAAVSGATMGTALAPARTIGKSIGKIARAEVPGEIIGESLGGGGGMAAGSVLGEGITTGFTGTTDVNTLAEAFGSGAIMQLPFALLAKMPSAKPAAVVYKQNPTEQNQTALVEAIKADLSKLTPEEITAIVNRAKQLFIVETPETPSILENQIPPPKPVVPTQEEMVRRFQDQMAAGGEITPTAPVPPMRTAAEIALARAGTLNEPSPPTPREPLPSAPVEQPPTGMPPTPQPRNAEPATPEFPSEENIQIPLSEINRAGSEARRLGISFDGVLPRYIKTSEGIKAEIGMYQFSSPEGITFYSTIGDAAKRLEEKRNENKNETPDISSEEAANQLSEIKNQLVENGYSENSADILSREYYNRIPAYVKNAFARQKQNMQDRMWTDQLTGFNNRQWAKDKGYETVEGEVKDGPMLMVDLDKFKRVNDDYGHKVGDDVLQKFAYILRKNLRGKAALVRHGGEEIRIHLLTGIEKSDILKGVEAARQELKQQVFADGKLKGVSFSAGYGDTFVDADKNLYMAKDAGRDRTYVGGKEHVAENLNDLRTAEGSVAGIRSEIDNPEVDAGGIGERKSTTPATPTAEEAVTPPPPAEPLAPPSPPKPTESIKPPPEEPPQLPRQEQQRGRNAAPVQEVETNSPHQQHAEALAEALGKLSGTALGKQDIEVLVPTSRQQKVADNISKLTGKPVVFIRTSEQAQKSTGFGFDGATYRDRIWISNNADKPYSWVGAHETAHAISIEHPDLYNDFISFWRENASDKGKAAAQERAKKEGSSVEYGERELVGDYLAENLNNPTFWTKLWAKSPVLVQKVLTKLYQWTNKVQQILGKETGARDEWFNDATAQRTKLARMLEEVKKRRKAMVTEEVFDPMASPEFMLRAFHGSPHKFEEFKSEKIGTGEGAQAFGYGLYFTSEKDIAKHYANKLGDSFVPDMEELKEYFKPGRIVPSYGGKDKVVQFNDLGDNGWSVVVQGIDESGKPIGRLREHRTLPSTDQVKTILGKSNRNNTYSVTLHKGKTPDQYDYLKWDEKPTKEHINKIMAAADREWKEDPNKNVFGYFSDERAEMKKNYEQKESGQEIYEALALTRRPKGASDFLLNAGIDGIDYPAGSISGVKSTARNYVVFDPRAVTIETVEPAFLRKEVPDRGQVEINPTNPQAQKAQDAYYKNEADLKKKFEPTKRQVISQLKHDWVDIGAPWKDALEKYHPKDAWEVEKYHNIMRGAPAFAELQVSDARKSIFKDFDPAEFDVWAQRRINKRIVETSDIMASRKEEGSESPDYLHYQGLTKEDAQAWLDDFKNQHPELDKKLESIDQKFNDLISNQQLNRLVEEGLMSPDVRDNLLKEHAHYNPAWYIQHIDPTSPGISKSGARLPSVHDSGIKGLTTGSTNAMISNPLVMMADIISRTESRIAKNRASRAIIKFVENNPDNALGIKMAEVGGKDKYDRPTYHDAPAGYTKIEGFYEDGSRKAVYMPDEYAKTWVNYDPEISPQIAAFLDVLTGAKLFKMGATGYNPAFVISNIPMDLAHTWASTKDYHPLAPAALVQMGKDIADVLPDFNKKMREYIRDGGGMDLLSMQGQLKKHGTQILNEWQGALSTAEATAGFLSKYSELLIRLAHRERVLKNLAKDVKSGKMTQREAEIEATARARNRLDYSQGGSYAKAADHVVPFFNAAIQGTRGILGQFKDPKTRGEAILKASQVTALGFSLAYIGNKMQPQKMNEISDQIKASNYVVPFWTPDSYIDANGNKVHLYYTIKKDQGQSVFAAIGEIMGEMAATGKPPSWDRLGYALSNLTPADASVVFEIPTVKALMALYNKKLTPSGFRDIWPGREVSPSKEVKADTPPEWEIAGKATENLPKIFQISPARMKEAFASIIPETNAFAVALGYIPKMIFDNMQDGPEKVKAEKSFVQTLPKVLLVNRFIRETRPQPERRQRIIDEAKQYNVPIKPEEQSLNEMAEAVQKKKIEENDKKQDLDITMERMALAAKGGGKNEKQRLEQELETLRESDIDEYRRIVGRIKDKHPELVEDITIVSTIKNPRSYEDLKTINSWYEKADQTQIKNVTSKLGGSTKMLAKRIRQYRNPPDWFKQKIKKLLSDRKKNSISQVVYNEKFSELMRQLHEETE